MEQSDRMKEARRGLNARLLLLAAGIMLVVNAVSSSTRTGLSWLSLADLVTQAQIQPVQTEGEEALEDAGESAAADTEAVTGEALETDHKTSGETTAEPDHEISAEPAEQEFDIGVFIEEMNKSGLTSSDLRTFGIFYMITAVVEIIAGMICAILSNRVDKSKITFTVAVILAAWELIFVAFLLLRGGLMLSVLLNAVLLPAVLVWSAWQMRKMARTDPERIFAVKPTRSPARKETAPAPPKSIKERANWAAQEETKEREEEM